MLAIRSTRSILAQKTRDMSLVVAPPARSGGAALPQDAFASRYIHQGRPAPAIARESERPPRTEPEQKTSQLRSHLAASSPPVLPLKKSNPLYYDTQVVLGLHRNPGGKSKESCPYARGTDCQPGASRPESSCPRHACLLNRESWKRQRATRS